MAGSKTHPVITVRVLDSIPDYQGAVHLQQEIWGFSELDSLPTRLFVVASKIGGHSFGAFVGERMIGFCVALPGLKQGEAPYLHSNMLGVVAEYRNAGAGRLLKLAQREEALSHGIKLMEWTFDPLEIKNAYFNMERLGAVMRALLRAGVYELMAFTDVPVKVVISEYVTLARSFFSESETGFVNGILDKISREVRILNLDEISLAFKAIFFS